ncbi:MAG: hypothetical protein GC159_16660 [Phycisphaera sp.]|nr:hypothetical protein [Phycisphaera sp.]
MNTLAWTSSPNYLQIVLLAAICALAPPFVYYLSAHRWKITIVELVAIIGLGASLIWIIYSAYYDYVLTHEFPPLNAGHEASTSDALAYVGFFLAVYGAPSATVSWIATAIVWQRRALFSRPDDNDDDDE